MPPALSDEEGTSSADEIPYNKVVSERSEAEDEGDAGGDADEEEEFVVEKVLSHNSKGVEVLYEVKWQGYEAKKDRTWEPESNLDGAREVLREYWETIDGKPEPQGSSKKRKGRKSAVDSEVATAAETKRTKKEKEWSPPPGSWENDVAYVDTVEESIDPKTSLKARFAYLVWTNAKKTQHPLKHVYHKCPQKMLSYYESHLVFTNQEHEDRTNGLDKEDIMRDSSEL